MLETYDIIVNQFNNLKHINTLTENIYSNIAYQTKSLAFQYNEVIEEKDNIIMNDIETKYRVCLNLYDDIADNIVKITIEYESLVIEKDLLLLNVGNVIDTSIYNDLEKRIIDIVVIYNEYVEKYNIISKQLNDLHIIYTQIINRIQPNLYTDGPIILPEKYNYLAKKIHTIVETYNNALDLYNSMLISNLNLMKIKTREIEDNILALNIIINKESSVYSIRLFSVLLNIFIKHYRFMTYNEKLENLSVIQREYLNYLKNINVINKAFIISHLHPIYISPLLLLPNTSETIILKDNIISLRKISTYYATIAPDFIQFNVKLLTPNIRNNLLPSVPDLFKTTYDGTLYFYPDYRNKTYEIEVEAYSMLVSQMKYKFIVVENGFPSIKPIDFIDSNIRLGNLNNNTFNLNLRNYYSDSNILFMVSNISETLSNLTYDDIYTYKGSFNENCNIPSVTDNIIITPYLKGYPVLYEEYSNTPVTLSITTSPKITYDTFTFNFTDRSPYTYDLTQINEWYINVQDVQDVQDVSIVSIEYVNNTRKNLKNPDVPTIAKDPNSNVLYIYPDYRNGTYNVNIIIETLNDYALKNIIEMEITEGPVPKPIRNVRNLLLEHLLIKETLVFNANNYFSTNTNELLTYDYSVSNIYDHVNNVKLNTLPYNTFNITSSNLRFTPDYRNISYDLYVYAIDSVYDVRSDGNLILNIREDKILNKIDELYNQYDLGNDIMTIDIYDHLKLPVGQELRYKNGLHYSVSVDKDLRKSRKTGSEAIYITDGILYIDPDFRNDSYNVTVFIEAYEFVKVDSTYFTFSVSEVIAPYPLITNNNILIQNIVNNTSYNNITKTIYINELTIFNTSINLDLFFTNDINYSKTQYSITDSEYYTINNNTLVIKPNVRDISYTFSILATDSTYGVYKSESNLLNIEVYELPPIKLNTDNTIEYELTDNIVYINLDDIFISLVRSDTLRYYVYIETDEDIRLNVSTFTNAYGFDNNILKLYPDYRGIKYKLYVTGINFNYITQPLTYYVDITEAERLPPIPKLSIFEINVAYFSYYNENTLRINLENLFTHLKYYPNYVLRLSSSILQLEDFINISLGYLVVSEFVLTFNFTLNVFLFDVIENKKVNDEITINFKNNVQTLRFIGLNPNINITLEQINDNYRYDIIGLNGVIIDSVVTIINNYMTIKKNNILKQYSFVVNKVHITLNLIVKQIIYTVDNEL